MAFYQKAPQGKRRKINYANRGAWEEEGSRYRTGGKKQEDRDGRGRETDREERRNRTAGEKPFRNGAHAEPSRPDYSRRRSSENNPPRDGFSRGRSAESTAPRGKYPRGQKPESFAPRMESSADRQDYRSFEYRGNEASFQDCPENDHILCGRNPIREALRSGRDIEKLLVQKGELNGSAREIVQEAREHKIMVQEVDRRRLDEIAPHHQGLIAFASAYAYAEVDDMIALAEQRGEAPFLILLDGVTDPHNLGAVIRTAECVGAHGVIIPVHRSVGLTPAAVKASAGAVEYMKVARVVNLNRTIEDLQRRGIWTYAVTMDGKDYEKMDFRGGTALVIGAEGEGISRLTAEKCDARVSLPLKGRIDSLNASVAAGVMMYRVMACRRRGL